MNWSVLPKELRQRSTNRKSCRSFYETVGPEGTSFYSVYVDRQSDITIKVSEHLGNAELIFYAQDETYQDWTTSSQGYTMDIQAYFVELESTLYFAFVEYADEYSEGEGYTVTVTQSFILDSTGILIRSA